VVFTSDNGGDRYSDTWPFTGRKTELLEGGLRIPAVIRWPRRIPCGVVSEQVKIGKDWFPTLLAAAGSTPDPAFPSDGIDLPPVLTEAAAPISRKLFWRYKHNDQQAARGGNWKYLNILDNTRRPSSPQRGRAAAKTIQNLRASVIPRFIVKQGVYSVDKQRKWSRYINHLTGSC